MGQSATLYSVDKKYFEVIAGNPADLSFIKLARHYEIFDKSFEGLRFLLSKGQDKNKIELITEIFDPVSFLGEQIDFSTLDFDNLPPDIDLEKQPLWYNSPDKVSEIAQFLDTLSSDHIAKNFDADELNASEIYPSGIWNNHTEEEYAFNARHMKEEFQLLKFFFNKSNVEGDYVFCFVG